LYLYFLTSNLFFQPQKIKKTSKLTTHKHPTSNLTTRQPPTSKLLSHVQNQPLGHVPMKRKNHIFHIQVSDLKKHTKAIYQAFPNLIFFYPCYQYGLCLGSLRTCSISIFILVGYVPARIISIRYSLVQDLVVFPHYLAQLVVLIADYLAALGNCRDVAVAVIRVRDSSAVVRYGAHLCGGRAGGTCKVAICSAVIS